MFAETRFLWSLAGRYRDLGLHAPFIKRCIPEVTDVERFMFKAGTTPYQAAAFIALCLPMAAQPYGMEAILSDWHGCGLVDLPSARAAAFEMVAKVLRPPPSSLAVG